MWLRNWVMSALVSVWILSWMAWCTTNNSKDYSKIYDRIEQADIPSQNSSQEDIPLIYETIDSTKNQIFVCLDTDQEGSFTHTKVLESIDDPQNTVLEYPMSQLFQTYGNRRHPLRVSWVSKNYKALVWKDGIETDLPQWFSTHAWEVTTDTAYLINDTLRFSLINPELKDCFPEDLRDQLQQPGFEWFYNTEDSILTKNEGEDLNSSYDIVVKKLPSWKYALALYRDEKIFMATYVSVWLNSRKTKTWQFKILASNPYYYSKKYKSPMPDGLEFDEWGFWFHQGNVTWYPASHWCVRLPWVQADVLYSLLSPSVKNKSHIDVFIDNNLYKIEK